MLYFVKYCGCVLPTAIMASGRVRRVANRNVTITTHDKLTADYYRLTQLPVILATYIHCEPVLTPSSSSSSYLYEKG